MAELPKAVQEQLKKAEEAAQQATATATATATAEPEPTPQQPAAEPPQTAPRPRDEAEEWKQRFETLQGKYNAEVPRLHQQLQQAQDFSRQLAEELNRLKEEQENLRKATVEAPKPLLGDEERQALVDAFGEEAVLLLEKLIAQHLANAGIEELKSKVERLSDTLQTVMGSMSTYGETQTQVMAAQIVEQLRARVPDFDAINSSQEFADWLQQPDPVSGLTRTVIVQDAFQKMDVDRLVRLFELYRQESGLAQKQDEEARRSEALAQQVAPATVAATPSFADADPAALRGKIWTQDEYIRVFDPRFVREVGEERAAQLQAEADRAVAEGRMR